MNIYNSSFRSWALYRLLFGCGVLVSLSGCNVEGRVTIDGTPASGVAVSIQQGSEILTTNTDSNGDYSFEVPAGSYYVSMSAPAGYHGQPGRRIFKSSDTADVSGINFRLNTDTPVKTREGEFYGFYEDNGVISYQGIRAAQPPTGELRWHAPIDMPVSDAKILALAPGDMCIQLGDKLNAAPTSLYGQMLGSEDCLYLNVWKPADAEAGGKLPVMVWIYGGGNSLGESSTYTGKYLAETYNVVVVNFNYRMGPLGWFSLPEMHDPMTGELTRSGNFGTLDQINGLRWVQRNIDSFGGDAENVMVFGESAGASATLAMMASPLTAGLFHRAAVQSAALGWITDHTIWQPRSVAENLSDTDSPGHSSSSSEILVSALLNDGVATSREAAIHMMNTMSSEQISAYLKSKSPEELYSLYSTKLGAFVDMPTIIQDGVVIPEKDVLSLFRSGNYHKVPVILGTNRDEYKLFLLSRDDYTTEVADVLPIIQNNNDYQLAGRYYSDAWNITGMYELADAMAQNQNDVFVYRFDWDEQPDLIAMDMAEVLGAAHGLEIGYTMNNPDLAVTPSLSFALFTESNRSGREYLADTMSSYWAQLVRTGSPGNGVANELGHWNAWTPDATAARLMVFDTPEDQGTRMISSADNMDALRARVQSEDGFNSQTRYCNLYHEIFGSDAFLASVCE